MSNINRVVLTGNLTDDPEVRQLPSGSTLTKIRLAVDVREKVDGEWQKRPNFFDVTVWGSQGENAAKYLGKGRRIAVDGRLRWREWQTEDGSKRQAVEVVADQVTYLDGPRTNETADAAGEVPVPAGVGADGSSIPF